MNRTRSRPLSKVETAEGLLAGLAAIALFAGASLYLKGNPDASLNSTAIGVLAAVAAVFFSRKKGR